MIDGQLSNPLVLQPHVFCDLTITQQYHSSFTTLNPGRMHISEPPTALLQATLSFLTEKTDNVHPLYSFPPKPAFPFFSSFIPFLSIII